MIIGEKEIGHGFAEVGRLQTREKSLATLAQLTNIPKMKFF